MTFSSSVGLYSSNLCICSRLVIERNAVVVRTLGLYGDREITHTFDGLILIWYTYKSSAVMPRI